jgi:hypothetical protein
MIEEGIANWSTVGGQLIDGFIDGVKSRASAAIEAAKSVASSVLQGAKSVLRIASPSKEAAELGGFFSEGMGQGIERNADYATRAARMMAEDALIASSIQIPQLGQAQSSSKQRGALSDKRITIVLPPGPLVQIVAGPGTNTAELLEQLEPGIRALFIRIMQQVAQEA